MKRNRAAYSLWLLAVIAAGLGSRKFPTLLPAFMQKGTGDALWATMVFLLLGIGWPRASTIQLGAIALMISFVDEFSQMYHAPWIDAIRRTVPGHLVLGEGFNVGDLAWYVVGAGCGVAAELMCFRSTRDRPAEEQA